MEIQVILLGLLEFAFGDVMKKENTDLFVKFIIRKRQSQQGSHCLSIHLWVLIEDSGIMIMSLE